MKSLRNVILEDSLDDFDISGDIARKRESVSTSIKKKIDRILHEYCNNIIDCCEEFFKRKNINMKFVSHIKRFAMNEYRVEFPDLSWGFTYSSRDGVSFRIYISDKIENLTENSIKELLKELCDFIWKEIPELSTKSSKPFYDIYYNDIGTINATTWTVRITQELQYLK